MRHTMGEQKYGPGKFLQANTVEEALFEIVDMANYLRYTFIKLMLLNERLDEMTEPHRKGSTELGPDAFHRSGDHEWGKG